MLTEIVCTIIILIIIKIIINLKDGKGPPGPSGLPFIGVAHKIDSRGLHYSVMKWSEGYGDVIKFGIFGETFVALNSYETIYTAVVTRSTEFAGRLIPYRLKIYLDNQQDIVFSSYSAKWLAMKKITLKSFKMYGSNLKVLQEISLELIKEMLEELKLVADSGEAINIKPILHRYITTIITSIIYGRKMDDETTDSWFEVEEEVLNLLSMSPAGILLDICPWARHLPFNNLYKDMVLNQQKIRKIVESEIQKSRKNYQEGQVNCFIDGLFKHQSENMGKPLEEQLSDEDIYQIMNNMNSAGTITTSLTLMVLLACLINKPEIQQKIAEEIKHVIGDRPPNLNDRPSMPFVEATILETLRYHTMFPLNINHKTLSKQSIGGYDIPKDTPVLFNLWKLHHDPEFWDEPWEFKPERFLENGMVVPVDHPNRKRVIAFGAGRRACVGEVLAKNRMFLMVTSLLQHFVLLPEDEDKRPIHDPRTYDLGAQLLPLPYKVRLSRRK